MRVSLNQIKQFLDFELPPTDELVKRIGAQLGEVEEVIDLGAKYKDAVIAKVVKCDEHPDADKLSVCEIDAGTGENIQVVCGAPNVREGIFVVWLPPKSTVPATYDDKQPFVLEPKELRGVISHGMLASAKELAISDSHEGILEVTKQDILDPKNHNLEPGASFAKNFGLNDTIIDIENKMFTHRPDCFGQLGVAREIAGILGHEFISPKWYKDQPSFEEASSLELDVFNDDTDKTPRFMALAIKDIEVKPSPLWLQCALVAMGSKPINNIVDASNYVMLTTAQPTHAYDYDKIRDHKLGARLAKKGEKATLLNGKEYEFDDSDIVIADSEGPIGLAGIMGGLDSEVSTETKNIVLEVANFDMYTLRRSSMKHGLFTDALTRFNKGQSLLQTDHVMKIFIAAISDVSPADQASPVFDVNDNKLTQTQKVDVLAEFINQRLGLKLAEETIKTILANVEFEVGHQGQYLTVSVPFWRTDIEIPEDIVEEVGRLYGYDKLELELPKRSIKPARKNELIELKQNIREILAKAGANETLTYSFVPEKLLVHSGQNPAHAFKVTNTLSPDLQYYRLSILPSLLEKVHNNIKSGHNEFVLFEIGSGHIVGQNDKDNLPREDELTALVVTANNKLKKTGSAYYLARKYLINLTNSKLIFKQIPKAAQEFDITKPFDMKRSAFVYAGETLLGIIGEFHAEIRRNLKLPNYTAGFELDTKALTGLIGQTSYMALPKYPKVTQDITLKVPTDLEYQDLYDQIWKIIEKSRMDSTFATLAPIGIYQSEGDKSHKNITFRLEIASYEKTLKAEQVNQMLDQVAQIANNKLGAERV